MDQQELDHFRQRILAIRKSYQDMIDDLRADGLDRSLSDSTGEFSTYDNHSSDVASETFEREKDFGFLDNAMVMLERADDALKHIDEGTYGVCENCGREIPRGRLEAMPLTTLCLECRRELDIIDRYPRPIEELNLQEPFARTFTDETDSTAYDGEDAWQEVARWGNANSPQDVSGGEDYDSIYIDSAEDAGIVQKVEKMIDEKGEPLEEEKNW